MTGTSDGQEGAGVRITAAIYHSQTVTVEPLPSLESVPGFLEVRSGAHVWVDVRTDDISATLEALGVTDPGPGPAIMEEETAGQTVMSYTHTVRGSTRVHRTVIASAGPDVLLSVHDSAGEMDSKLVMMGYIETLVEKELSGLAKPILYFRDMLLAGLLDTQADEFIATLQEIVRQLSTLNQRLLEGRIDTGLVREELFRVHMFVEDEFPAALLAFREVVAKLRMGAGRNFDLTGRRDELEDVLRDVDGAVDIKANVEKTIDFIAEEVRMKLTERQIDTQWRLQRAVWMLTRLSVLLLIPNMVFIFWRITPWIGSDEVELGSLTFHSFWLSIPVAFLLTLAGMVLLNRFLGRHLGGRVDDDLAGGDGGRVGPM